MSTALPHLNPGDLPRIREALGFDQAAMAERIGVSRQHYADLESGRALLSVLLDNAIRWVEHTRGAPPSDVCGACNGLGTVRAPVDPAHPRVTPPRLRCEVCDGEAVVRLDSRRRPIREDARS